MRKMTGGTLNDPLVLVGVQGLFVGVDLTFTKGLQVIFLHSLKLTAVTLKIGRAPKGNNKKNDAVERCFIATL